MGVPRGELFQLPPAFHTVSAVDQDVVYVFSQTVHVSMLGSFFFWVYGLEYDYDRDSLCPEDQELYQKALGWLDEYPPTGLHGDFRLWHTGYIRR